MNKNELHERLIDYAEGNISPDEKAEIESLLAKTPQLQNELDLIQSALTELSTMSDDNVPQYYFTNFLPLLRERMESGNVRFPWSVPEWLRLFSATAIISVICFSIGVLYQSFKPEKLQSPIYSMVNEMERAEINTMIDETIDFESTPGVIRNVENIVSDLSSASAVESKLTEDLLVLDVTSYQTDHELISDIGDQEMEQVLELLTKPSVQ